MKLYVCLNKFFGFPMSLYRLVIKYIYACYFERIKKTSQEIVITKIWSVDLPALLISGVEVMKSMAVCSGLSSAAHDIPSFFCRRGGVCCNSFNKQKPAITNFHHFTCCQNSPTVTCMAVGFHYGWNVIDAILTDKYLLQGISWHRKHIFTRKVEFSCISMIENHCFLLHNLQNYLIRNYSKSKTSNF